MNPLPLSNDIFLDYAREGVRFPIATDLVLRRKPDHESIMLHGPCMGDVILEASDLYGSPMALPIMDLTTEKNELLINYFGVSPEASLTWHFDEAPSAAMVEEVRRGGKPFTPRLQANIDAIRHCRRVSRKPAVGMAIGPFSLMSKLVAAPIEPVFMVGMGLGAEDDEEVALVLRALELAEIVILRSLEAQIAAGAQAIFIAEPAANLAYISPNQMESGSDVFERLVLNANRKIVELLRQHDVKLIFHCCGELIDPMLDAFCSLKPHLLSLGSSRDLVRDSVRVPKEITLYGNLPSKKFYSDDLITVEETISTARKLASDMAQAGHPFILGSECDVLSVPGSEQTILRKVLALAGR